MSWTTVKEEALLACKRYCCLCEEYKGINIEVHHIIPKSQHGTDTFDNAIPLCFDCHSMVGSYNPKHPKGNRFSVNELKTIRDSFYNKVEAMPRNASAYPQCKVLNNANNAEYWQNLYINLQKYQASMEYAYECWKGNFKYKYPKIHSSSNSFGNVHWQMLQEEIDCYGNTLYRDIFEIINRDYCESRNALSASIVQGALYFSIELQNLLIDYMNCMSFHYDSDGNVGIIDYYWSSFFVCLDKNYEKIKQLKTKIDKKIKAEYRANDT
ncbi:HNH endonuclease [Butyrivibrio sp. AC2005]|uniref:HNH endonuclease n=1 Tax=Butyrivibrio sp. AC2005 TaxID=1280672 RepID=UPI0003F86F07|nr:HNH endonuclease [Butyrivibrio sp. AC2005]